MVFLAPEGRQRIAHGVSRGRRRKKGVSPGGATETRTWRRFCRPSGAWSARNGLSPGVTPRAIFCRPSGAEHRYREVVSQALAFLLGRSSGRPHPHEVLARRLPAVIPGEWQESAFLSQHLDFFE